MSESEESFAATIKFNPDETDNNESGLPNRDHFHQLVHLANKGDQEALQQLRQTLDEHPEIWQQVGDLGKHAEFAMIKLLAGDNHLLRESIQRQLADLREQLAGPDPSPLEKLAVERVVACWLHVQHVDIRVAHIGESLKEAKYWGKRQDQAHRRYEAAMKMLATLRHLMPAAIRKDRSDSDADQNNEALQKAV